MICVPEYKAFRVELIDKIAHVQINRPEKVNAMNVDFWEEIIEIFRWVDETDEVGDRTTGGKVRAHGALPAARTLRIIR